MQANQVFPYYRDARRRGRASSSGGARPTRPLIPPRIAVRREPAPEPSPAANGLDRRGRAAEARGPGTRAIGKPRWTISSCPMPLAQKVVLALAAVGGRDRRVVPVLALCPVPPVRKVQRCPNMLQRTQRHPSDCPTSASAYRGLLALGDAQAPSTDRTSASATEAFSPVRRRACRRFQLPGDNDDEYPDAIEALSRLTLLRSCSATIP
ncbi:MAG: hypothetical protein ACLSVD_01180 [Eggerthellaceae bacterium]